MPAENTMSTSEVWRAIDGQRLDLADFLDGLAGHDWDTPSLCAGWRVRDVAAHLTLAHTGTLTALGNTLRAGGSMNRMIRDTAIRQARLPAASYAPLLRAMTGSRKTAPGLTPLEPLIDVLVHGQDMALPLGRTRTMPVPAAATAATRVWTNRWPFSTQRKFSGLRFAATDCPWTAGDGPLINGPITAILLTLTSRDALLTQLTGPGTRTLSARISST